MVIVKRINRLVCLLYWSVPARNVRPPIAFVLKHFKCPPRQFRASVPVCKFFFQRNQFYVMCLWWISAFLLFWYIRFVLFLFEMFISFKINWLLLVFVLIFEYIFKIYFFILYFLCLISNFKILIISYRYRYYLNIDFIYFYTYFTNIPTLKNLNNNIDQIRFFFIKFLSNLLKQKF